MLLQPNFHSVRRRSGRLGRLRGRKSLILGEARARSTEIVTKPGLASFWYRSPVFIRKTVKRYKDKIYTNYLLVETVSTPQGPRQRTLCSLGSLPPGPKSKWPGLIGRVEAALLGQTSLESQDPLVTELVTRVRTATSRQDIVSVHTDQLRQEEAREAGPVHVGHQMWRRLGIDDILLEVGFSPKARRLTEVMVLNRLVAPCSEHAMPDWVRRTATFWGLTCRSLPTKPFIAIWIACTPIEARSRPLWRSGRKVCLISMTVIISTI